MHGAILAHGGKLVPHAVKQQKVKKLLRMLKDLLDSACSQLSASCEPPNRLFGAIFAARAAVLVAATFCIEPQNQLYDICCSAAPGAQRTLMVKRSLPSSPTLVQFLPALLFFTL